MLGVGLGWYCHNYGVTWGHRGWNVHHARYMSSYKYATLKSLELIGVGVDPLNDDVRADQTVEEGLEDSPRQRTWKYSRAVFPRRKVGQID